MLGRTQDQTSRLMTEYQLPVSVIKSQVTIHVGQGDKTRAGVLCQ